jgi:hypothetical protein
VWVRPLCVTALVVSSLAIEQSHSANVLAQEPPVEQVMQRVGDYVRGFVDALSNVVAEERYEPDPRQRGRRRLRSDYLLVRSPRNERNFLAFRDVLEVNGKQVENHQETLTKLFLQPSEDALKQAMAISAHSEQYLPSITDPLLAVIFLQREYQTRFRYMFAERDPGLGPDVRRIVFVESHVPTILGRTADGEFPTRGTAWVNEATGRVSKTELQIGNPETPLTLTTVFGVEDSLKIDVPLELSESSHVSGVVVKGVAKYSRFRRFGVRTNEKIETPTPEAR